MNFDELKKQWDKQSSEDVKISKDFENNKEANTIIDKVRKTLRNDFFLQLTSISLLLAFPYLIGLSNQLIWWVVICYCATIIIPISYIFRFYKRSYKLEYNSLKNINWFYYNYKSSIDIFSIYTLIVCVLMIMFFGIVYMEKMLFYISKIHFYYMFTLFQRY